MARPRSAPGLPTTPGGWLACYRYRLLDGDGQPSSPEDIGGQLGVSGDTVRRWEANRALPSDSDLRRFSEVCRLSPIERAFLVRAFSAVPSETASESGAFGWFVEQVLAIEFPAYIYDSLFFIRAWNSYIEVAHRPLDPGGEHLVERILAEPDPRYATNQNLWSTRPERAEWWLRDFWYETAELCGSPAYVKLMEKLARSEQFAEKWPDLGLLEGAERPAPIGRPRFRVDPVRGSFLTTVSAIVLPPTYYVRMFLPSDATAWNRLEERRQASRPTITMLSCVHWDEPD